MIILNSFWKTWKKLTSRAMELQTKIILAVLYFTLLVPIGIWFRWTKNVFAKKSQRSNWYDWQDSDIKTNITKM